MQHEDDNLPYAEYRVKYSYFYLGVAFTGFLLIIGISFMIVSVIKIAEDHRPALYPTLLLFTFFTVSWLPMVLVGIYLIVAFFKEKIILQPGSFSKRTVFSVKSVSLEEICNIDWSLLPRTSAIKIQTTEARITIHASEYAKQDRDEIIDYFRSAVPKELQTDWEEAQERLAKLSTDRFKFTWQFYARMAMLFFLGSIASFYLRSHETAMDLALLVIGVICILLGVASLAGSLFCFYKKKEKTQS